MIEKLNLGLEKMDNVRFGKFCSQRKLLRVKLKALRPLTLYAGVFDHRFIKIGGDVKLVFMENMVDFTITALLA